MGFEKIADYTDVFLRTYFSVEDGWTLKDDFKIGSFLVDYWFEQQGGRVCLVQRILEPIVMDKHVRQAVQLHERFNRLYPSKSVEVILVYGNLLLQPKRLPKGVSVVSITEESQLDSEETLLEVSYN